METRHLRYFVAVAEELHFTRAATRLRTAQPALSQQIRRLERELGAPLFDRTNRRVELTATGRVLLEHARRVLDEVDRAKLAVDSAVRGDLGTLTIGFTAQSSIDLLPDLLVAYRARHPAVEVELRELSNVEQADALTGGRIDLGLMTRRLGDSRVRALPLRRLRLVVALPTSHRLADRRSVRFDELADEPWIHPAGHSGPFAAACAKAGFEPVIVQEASEHATRMALVAAGMGLAVDVESAPSLPGGHVVYRPLTNPRVTVDLVAAWRTDRSAPLVDGFLEVARARRSAAVDPSVGGRP